MKTVRFADVVKRFGAPTLHLQWGPPARDAALQSALKAGRVMTIQRPLHGAKKDFGLLGFFQERHAQILIFPRSIKALGAARIVGIDFDLLATAGAPYQLPPLSPKRKPPADTPAPAPAKPSKEIPAPSATRRPAVAIKAPPPAPPASAPKLPPAVAAQIQKALRDLKSGKTVAAYERLAALVR